MSTVDRRIAVRRRQVAEDHARGRLYLVMWGIVGAIAIGALVWAIQSPLLDVDRVEVTGVHRSSVTATLEALEISPGLPLVAVRSGSIAEALESDPWVADAAVRVVWPNRVEVSVAERVPIVVIALNGSDWLVATDGIVLAPAAGERLARIEVMTADSVDVGAVVPSDVAIAVAFAAALDAEVAASANLTVGEGGLEAVVAGYPIRLGTGEDMAEKARVVSALVATGPPAGSTIDVLAPSRPSIVAPTSAD
ncbi:MAG: FtsQ-type POTRA domain-containing protein [Acidimicrobiia bacterium]|nr:FtsQ-type POTRA domain-containing protein [Acidimicrobiia bacterium]